MDLKKLKLQGTVINFFPFPITSIKPGLVPALFEIPAGNPIEKKFSVFHVDSVIARTYVGELGGGWREELCPASELCDSLVNDFYNDSIYTDKGRNLGPGITWVENIFTEKQLRESKEHQPIIEQTYVQQTDWFKILVQHADDSWSKLRQHRVISDLQRYAAAFLKLDREWLTALEIQKTQNVCEVCGTMVPLTAIKCFNCGYILNEEAFAKIKHRFDMVGAAQAPAQKSA